MLNTPPGKPSGIIAPSLGGAIVGTSLILLLLLGATSCSESNPGPSAEITSFEPASGSYRTGDEVVSSLRFENTGSDEQTFWVGHSVQDGAGRWHDAPSDSITLGPGEESEIQKRSWNVPDDSRSPAPTRW